MLLFQIVIPAVLVFITFIVGHFFISSSGSGLYLSELNIEIEEVSEVPEDINPIDIDPETGLILPDKYNYLKIENVFREANWFRKAFQYRSSIANKAANNFI